MGVILTQAPSARAENLSHLDYVVGDGAGAKYQTIQSAIDAASSGDTVWVMAGTYTENLTLKAGVAIRAVDVYRSAPGVVGPFVRIVGHVSYSGGFGQIHLEGLWFDGSPSSGTAAIDLTSLSLPAYLVMGKCKVYGYDAPAVDNSGAGPADGNLIAQETSFYRFYTSVDGPTVDISVSGSDFEFHNCLVDGNNTPGKVAIEIGDNAEVYIGGAGQQFDSSIRGKVLVSGGSGTLLRMINTTSDQPTGDHVTVTGSLDTANSYYRNCYGFDGAPYRIGGANAAQLVEIPQTDAYAISQYDGTRWGFTTTPTFLGLTLNGDLDLNAGGAIKGLSVKTGATQVAAGAAAGEVWATSGHATLPDNVLMIGV